MFRVCHAVFLLQPSDHLLGKDWPLGSLVCDVFLCFCHFPMWCPGSGVVLLIFAFESTVSGPQIRVSN